MNFKKAITHARTGGPPLAAFNIVDYASFVAVSEAAREAGKPVIAQVSARTVQYYGAATIGMLADQVRQRTNAKCFLHLDHAREDTVIEAACTAGFDGFMIDASDLAYDANVRRTREWVRRGHAVGMVVEGEIGAIRGAEEDVAGGECVSGPTLEQCERFAADTGVDFLGADIGTTHGLYASPPAIRFSFIEQIVPRIKAGFVVHGGSGLDGMTLRVLADLKVAKINFSTELKIAWAESVRKATSGESVPEPLLALQHAHQVIKDLVHAKLRSLDGAGGQA
ncbi:MAG: hypothetical protein DMD54_17770 [Gemmatimonadetes bacterium]|nr:MAG: hypothetical protein DMD54_17770 [Gemmatimonadota bacterium]